MPSPTRPDPIAAALLAAGESSRMGAHKLLADLHGEPLGLHALRSLAATDGLGPIVVVLGRDAEQVGEALSGLGARFVVNEQYASGIASSFRTGAQAVAGAAALFALADQPLVPSAHHAQLAARSRAELPEVVATRSDGVAMPPHVARGAALDAVRKHGQGVQRLLERFGEGACFVDLDAGAVADVDEPPDLERVRARPVGG